MTETLEAPPRTDPDATGVRPRPAPATSRQERGRLYRKALLAGLALSVLLHLAALLVGGFRFGAPPPAEIPPPPAEEEGLEVVEIRLPEPPPPEEPRRRRPEDLEVVEAVPRVPAEPRAELPGRRAEVSEEAAMTNAERLRPRMGDERLWVDFNDPISVEERESYDRAVAALRRIVRQWLDSLKLTEEQRQRAMDWTVGKGDRKWGISAEGLHLGDITIPLPIGQFLSEGGPRAREAQRALRELREIRNQDVRAEVDETLKERREAMRERSREEAEKGKSKPDTTSTGGGGPGG